MNKKYFVIKDGKDFLWEDGNFYPAFINNAYAVDEDSALEYKEQGYEIEYAEPNKWPELYGLKEKEIQDAKKPRRTYIRVSVFTLAAALDRLYDDEHTYNVMLSMEDGDFLISFEYRRDYERPQRSTATCNCEATQNE